MSRVWDRPLPVGKRDNYSVTVKDEWLENETLVSGAASSTADPANIVLGTAVLIEGKTVSVSIQGVTAGFHEVHFDYGTATRSGCAKAIVKVIDECP